MIERERRAAEVFDGRGAFTAYTSKSSNLPDDNVFSLLVDHAGRLWVGTRAAGLWAFYERAGFRIGPPAQLVEARVLVSNVVERRIRRELG